LNILPPQPQLAKIISKSSFIEQQIKLVRWLSREQDKNQTFPIKKEKNPAHSPGNTKHKVVQSSLRKTFTDGV